ncbi:membrane-spanning 4-domains subfamily A member 3 [Nothobranchius furzeri]|uniref:Uncharacterized protein n=1 Tax=Nothobranchius furzeri TaxID=105023 RepID=A0A8C6Q5K5_NOTFU
MRKTFVCDESIIITIHIGSLRNAGEGQLMLENFNCVFKDNFKIFAIRGKPKPLGAAQAMAGVFLLALGLISDSPVSKSYTVPSVLFVLCGMLSYAAGRHPNMHVTKLSFSLNIISFFWSLVAFSLHLIWFRSVQHIPLNDGLTGLMLFLLVGESIIALFLIFWLSKAVCRDHFNSLPIIMLKQDE